MGWAGLLTLLATVACNSSDTTAVNAAAGTSAAGSASLAGAFDTGGSPASSAGSVSAGGSAGATQPMMAPTLTALVPSVGAFVPVFNPSKTSYTLRVPNGTASVSLTPTAGDGTTAITVAGAMVASGTASPVAAIPGDGKLTLDVTASGAAPLASAKYTITVSVQAVPTRPTLYSVGDSTMADYQVSMYPNQAGWMQMFPQLVSGDVGIVNSGLNGTSSKSFYRTPSWDRTKNLILPGDYVFIQFGHNDEKDGGIEGASGVGTAAWDAYHDYLSKYVSEAKALGGIPILFTPVVRLGWTGTKLSAKSNHDLTPVGGVTDSANYPAAMRDVAKTLGCPLIDLTVLSRALVEQYGPLSAKANLYISTDDTHLQPFGALSFAQLAARELVTQGILVSALKPDLGLVVSEASLDFGKRYVTTTAERTFSVYGVGLAPATGSVSIQTVSGFDLSTITGTPGPQLSLPYAFGALPPTTVRVLFTPSVFAQYGDTLNVKPGSGTPRSVALVAAAVALPDGASEVEARYPLDAASGTACVAVGAATCAAESLAGLYAKDYATITQLLPTPSAVVAQRLSIVSSPQADSWPLEAMPNPTRFVEFTLTPNAGKSASIDSVSLYAGAGGPVLGLRASASTHADFSAPVELFDVPNNDANVLVFRSASPVVSVAPGEMFRVRVYPFSKAASTASALRLKAVSIHGVSY